MKGGREYLMTICREGFFGDKKEEQETGENLKI
jgi:hypothetical protein